MPWRTAAAVRLRTERVWPAYAVISVGGPVLLQRVDGADRRRQLQCGQDPSPVLLRQDASAAAASVVEGVAMFVQVLRVEMPGVIPVIESVVPVLDASGEGLTACRRLSESLRQVAKHSGALFLDVEEVVQRHLAGAAQPTSCSGAGAQRPDERTASALAASPVDASGGIRLVVAATKSTYEAVAAANIAATTAEASAAAAINKEDYQRAVSDAAEAARTSKAEHLAEAQQRPMLQMMILTRTSSDDSATTSSGNDDDSEAAAHKTPKVRSPVAHLEMSESKWNLLQERYKRSTNQKDKECQDQLIDASDEELKDLFETLAIRISNAGLSPCRVLPTIIAESLVRDIVSDECNDERYCSVGYRITGCFYSPSGETVAQDTRAVVRRYCPPANTNRPCHVPTLQRNEYFVVTGAQPKAH